MSSDQKFYFIMGGLSGIVSVLGIVGNILALMSLSRFKRKSVLIITFIALSVSDLIMLISVSLFELVPRWCTICELQNISSVLCPKEAYIIAISYPICSTGLMNSIWLTVLLSVERYIAICHPFQAIHICTKHKATIAIIVITICSISFNAPRCFEFTIYESPLENSTITWSHLNSTYLRDHETYRTIYNLVLVMLFLYTLPMLIVTIMSYQLVKTVREARKSWEHLNRKQQKELQATCLPMCIVLVFYICGSQMWLGYILDVVFIKKNYDWLDIQRDIANFLAVFNSAINPVIMIFSGRRFRQQLRKAFWCHDESDDMVQKTTFNSHSL